MITIISNDAGGAQILSHFVKKNKNKYNYILTGPAKRIFKKNIGKYIPTTLKKTLNQSKLFICGTGWQSNLEKKAIVFAKLNQIKVVSFLDHWGNYKKRFVYKKKVILPDEIWVGDKDAYKKAKNIFSRTPIVLKKNYYFIFLKKKIQYLKKKVISNKLNILYLSEPITGVKKRLNLKIKYNEYQAFSLLLNNIHKISNNMRLKIRFHPSEKKSKYDYLIKKANFNILKSNTKDLMLDISRANIIIGCNSIALYIGYLAKKKIICCIPLRYKSSLPIKNLKYLRNFK